MLSAMPCSNVLNGAFRAVLSKAIRTRIADLLGSSAADEVGDLTIKCADLRHADQRPRIATELFRQSSDVFQAESIIEFGESNVAKAEPLRKK